MKKVILVFAGLGYNNCNQAIVSIYNKNGCLVTRRRTYNGRLCVLLNKGETYEIIAKAKCDKIHKYFIVTSYNVYTFYFRNSLFSSSNNRSITFLLTDQFYDNLKIEKGSLIFNG